MFPMRVGTAEDEDKGGEEKIAITAGTGTNTFLRLLDGTVRYMVDHIDNRQSSKANCFNVVSLYGAIEGPVRRSINGTVRVMKEVVAGSKTLFKTELYGMARLRSRDSDADFHDGKMMLDTGTETVESELDIDDTFFENGLREFETSVS